MTSIVDGLNGALGQTPKFDALRAALAHEMTNVPYIQAFAGALARFGPQFENVSSGMRRQVTNLREGWKSVGGDHVASIIDADTNVIENVAETVQAAPAALDDLAQAIVTAHHNVEMFAVGGAAPGVTSFLLGRTDEEILGQIRPYVDSLMEAYGRAQTAVAAIQSW